MKILELFLSDPEPIFVERFKVTPEIITHIDMYRRKLIQSRTIQVVNNGQAYSSLFKYQFLKSFKYQYPLHCLLSSFLQIADYIVDLLTMLKSYSMIYKLNKILMFDTLAANMFRGLRFLYRKIKT